MNEKEIFEHLFKIAPQSKDTDGVVTACLVRNDVIIADAVSGGVEHAEYVLLQKLSKLDISITDEDVVYVTLQPCDRRTSGKIGEQLGDCTTNLTKAGAKHVVYAATYPKSENSLERFKQNGVDIRQTSDLEIQRNAALLFNATNEDSSKHIPVTN